MASLNASMCVAVDVFEFGRAALFAIEQLQHCDAGDVFLQVGVDLGDRDANAPVALRCRCAGNMMVTSTTRGITASISSGHARAELEHRQNYERQHENVADDGDQPGSEQVVQHVHVRCHASHQAPDGISVEKCNIERLQVRHQLPAQIEHGLLAGPLHQVGLAEIEKRIRIQLQPDTRRSIASSPSKDRSKATRQWVF